MTPRQEGSVHAAVLHVWLSAPGCLPAPCVWAMEQELPYRVVIVLPRVRDNLEAELLRATLRLHALSSCPF